MAIHMHEQRIKLIVSKDLQYSQINFRKLLNYSLTEVNKACEKAIRD